MGRRDCKRRRHSRKRFWRVYLHGVLLIVVVGLAVALAAHFKGGDSAWHEKPERLLQFVANELGTSIDDPLSLRSRLEHLHERLDVDLAVYHPSGASVAAAGLNPPPPLSADTFRKTHGARWVHEGRCRTMAVPIGNSGGHTLMVRWCGSRSPEGFFFLLALIFGALAVGSIPLARAIARPLEKLTETANVLGGGDLSARTGVDRKDEVGHLARAIDSMASRLEHRIRSERELLANISHEIRTPLARIRVALELCDEEEGGIEDLKARLAEIARDVTDLDRLVEQVLVIVRLDLASSAGEQARFRLHLEPTPAKDLVGEVVSGFEATHPDRTLRVDAPAETATVRVDRALTRRVLDNLLDNAAKFSDPAHPIELVATPENGGIRIAVHDQGIGVAVEDLPRLFEPFFRTDRSRARDKGGVGLGLTLCARIIEAHGGEIEARPNEPQGLVVGFTLPV